MDPQAKNCPKCGSAHYMFKGRKQIEATSGKEPAIETKYRCKTCGHQWKVTVATSTRSG